MARVKLDSGLSRPAEKPRKDFQEVLKVNFLGCELLGVSTDQLGRRRWIYDIGHCTSRPVVDDQGDWYIKRRHKVVGVWMGGHDSQIQPACWYNLDKLETDHPGVGSVKKKRIVVAEPATVSPNGKQRRRVKVRTRVKLQGEFGG